MDWKALAVLAVRGRLSWAELAETLLNDSQRVLPAVLESSGFTFRHPTLRDALTSLLR